MLSVSDVASHLGVSRRTVYGLVAPAGPIPCYRIGRRIIFSDDDIRKYLEKCRYTEIKMDSPKLSRRSAVRLKSAPQI